MLQEDREKAESFSAHSGEGRLGRLRELFPEAFSEGRVDGERLLAALGDAVDGRPEYTMSDLTFWSSDAIDNREMASTVGLPARVCFCKAPQRELSEFALLLKFK